MKDHSNIRTQLQGQAGVWAVAAQLAIRGHIPIFPGVDHGFDLMLENGLRLQIKTARLSVRKRGRYGEYPGYHFNLRKTVVNATRKIRSVKRDWSRVADYFVLWGIDANRFWIIPTSHHTAAIWLADGDPLESNPKMKGGKNPQYAARVIRKAACENRWDLLDVNTTAESLVESAIATEIKEIP